jgi:hypothetical protein
MDLSGNEVMDVTDESFQQNASQTRGKTNKNSRQEKKLVLGKFTFQPMEEDLETKNLFHTILGEILFKPQEAVELFYSVKPFQKPK